MYELLFCFMNFPGSCGSYTISSFRTECRKALDRLGESPYLCLPMPQYITISTATELLRIPADKLMFITAEGNWSKVYNQDGHSILVGRQLGQLEQDIYDQFGDQQTPFVRIGRSLIVNKDYIYRIDTSEQTIIISNFCGQYFTQLASKQALSQIKFMIENGQL